MGEITDLLNKQGKAHRGEITQLLDQAREKREKEAKEKSDNARKQAEQRTAAHNNEQRKADRQQRLSAASVSPVKLPTASEGPTLPTFAQATAKSRAAYVQELQKMASRPEAILSQTKKEVDNLNVQIEEAKRAAKAAQKRATAMQRAAVPGEELRAAQVANTEAQKTLKTLTARRDMLASQYYTVENEGTLQANAGNTAFQNALQLQTDLQKVQDIVNQRSTMSGEERTAFVQGLAARYGTSNTGKLAQALMQELAQYEEQLKLQNVDVDRVAEFLRRQERAKQAQETREQKAAAAREMPVAASAASVLASPFQGIDMLKMLGTGSGSTKNLDSYVPYDTNVMTITDAVNTIRQTVSEEIEKNTDWEIAGQNVASFLYNTGMSVADSALMVATLGPNASYLMGLSAAANQSKNIAERGGTNRQALLGGLAAGAAEMIFERVEIEKLLTPKAGEAVWKSMLKQAGVEASEEMATEIANILADAAIMGERSEFNENVRRYMREDSMTEEQAKQSAFFDLIGQVAGAGIGGALSGGVMSGSVGAVNAIANGNKTNGVMGVNGTRALTQFYPGSDMEAYYRAFSAYYAAGVSGVDIASVETSGNISEEAQKAAYDAGRADAAQSLRQEKRSARKAQVAENAGLVMDDYTATMPQETVQRLDDMAKRFGTTVRFVDQVFGGEANAQLNNTEVLIEKNNPNPEAFLLGHEITHRMQALSPAEYRQFRDAIAPNVQQEANRLLNLYNSKGVATNYEQALDEATANYVGGLIQNTQDLDAFIAQNADNRNMLQKFLDVIRELFGKLTGNDLVMARTAEQKLATALQAAEQRAGVLTQRGRFSEMGEKNTATEGGERYYIDQNYSENFDDWIRRGKPDREQITVGTTSDALKSIDVPDKTITWDTSKINKTQRDHPYMTDGIIKQVPDILERPIVVMESKTQPNRLTILGEVYVENVPVMAVIELLPTDKSGTIELDELKVVNSYAKDKGNVPDTEATQKLIDSSNVLYIEPNKNRTSTWLSRTQLQLPFSENQYGSIGRITLTHRNSQGLFSAESEKTVEPEWRKALRQFSEGGRLSLKDDDGNAMMQEEGGGIMDINEMRLQQLTSEAEEIEDKLMLANIDGLSAAEEKQLRNRLTKAYAEIDKIEAQERKTAVKTPIRTIIDNLSAYRRMDLESLAEQVSDGAWDDYEQMSRAELEDALRETLTERMEDLTPLEAQMSKYGFYVKPPQYSLKGSEDAGESADTIRDHSGTRLSLKDNQAVERFGTTEDYREAGYILPDGRMLKFTDEEHPGERIYDHRTIGVIYGENVDTSLHHGFNKESVPHMEDFVEQGAIRFDPGEPDLNMGAGIQLSKTVPLTKEQEKRIKDFVEWKNEREESYDPNEDEFSLYRGPLPLTVEFGGGGIYLAADDKDLQAWDVDHLNYEGGQIRASRVISDIRHYYETGEIRKPSMTAQFRSSLKGSEDAGESGNTDFMFRQPAAAEPGTAEAVPRALEMLKAGETRFDVSLETGLYQGDDGVLRNKFGVVVYTPGDEVQAENVIEDEEERDYAQMERDAIYGRIDEEGNPVEIHAEETEREIVEAQKMQQTANAMQPSEAREAIDAFIRGESDIVPASELGMTEKPQESKTIRESVADSAHFIYRKMVDSGEAVSRVAKQAGDPTLYAYYNAARASGNAAVNMIVEAQTNVNGEVVGEALMDIFQPIIDKGERYYSNFQMYMWHRHNQSRMSLEKPENREAAQLAYEDYKQDHPELNRFDEARIREIAMYEGPYQAAAQGYVKALDELQRARNVKNKPVFGDDYSAQDSKAIADRLLQENPEFKELAERVYQYEKNLMQYRIDSGLVTQKQADIWAQMYPEYVPTLRNKDAAPAKKKGKAARVLKTVKTAEGGDTGLLPIHTALAAQTRSAVREGSKNRFGQKLLNARDKLGAFMTEVTESDDNIGEVDLDSRETVLDPEQQKNTFTIYKDGKAYTMQISEDLFEGVDALTPSEKEDNALLKVMSGSNNLFKLLITGYNPLFTIRNAIKDQQTVMINSKNYAQYAKMYPQAIREIAQNGPYWQQYKALGGTTSSVLNYKTDEIEKAKGLGKVMERIEAINLAVEQAPRLAEFMATLQSGDGSADNLMQAMLNAQDVTTNFGRSGTWGKMLNRYAVPFLNPSIQGTDRFVRSLTERKDFKGWLSLVAKCAIFGFAAPAINGLLYADDDEWDDLKDRDKNTYFLFKIGDGKWLKIHRGREFSAMSFMSALIKDVVSGEQVSVGDYLKEIYNQIGPSNPMENNILTGWTGAKLFNAENPGETWYGGDIESERLQGYAPGDRYDEKTDVVSKWIGGKLNISPKKLNYLIDQYTGVVGDVLLPALSPQAERDMLSSAFTIDSVRSNKYSGEFYDTMDQLEYAKNDPNASGVDKIAYRYWNKQNSIVGDINAAIREIEADPTLSQKEKKEQTRALMATRNAAQAAALGTLEAYTAAAERAYAAASGDEDDRIDEAYREANREIFGAEYAMQTYNKNAYENALPIVEAGVSWDSYYDYYFASRDAKKKSEKRAVINGMDISDEEKRLLYEGAVASEADLENMAQMEASGVEGETVRKIAYEIDGLQPTPGKEDVSAQQKFTAVAGMSGLSDAEKLGAILAYDQTEDASAYADYKAAYDAGLSVKEYDAYRVKASGITSDKDANGKTISGSKKEKVVAAIDAMPITDKQKDFLFLLDYAESGLDDTPWHSDRYAGQLPTAANGFRGQSGGTSTKSSGSIRGKNTIRGKSNIR